MKKYYLFVTLVCLITNVNAQITLQATPSDYNGYNISCFGAQDGSIDLTVTGSAGIFTYRWSNDQTTQDISGLAAGYYGVEVNDNDPNTEPARLEITLT